MNQEDNSLDDILNALAASNIPTPTPAEVDKPSEEEYNEVSEVNKALKEADDLIKKNDEILEEAKRLVQTTGDIEYFEQFANVSKSQSEAIKNKIKLLIEKEKNKISKQTNKRSLDIKERLADHQMGKEKVDALPAGTTLNQTNVILSGSREEMFDMLSKMQELEKQKQEKPAIEV